ncbi:MAG: hypothetical protein ACT4OZ_10315, partial [Gemmatimonadota bacterium]
MARASQFGDWDLISIKAAVLFACLALLPCRPSLAQTRELTADAAAIARTLRLQGHAGEAFEYLTERRARYTRASRDA